MAAGRNTLGDVVIDDEAIEGALVVHNFDVEKAVAHLIESGAPRSAWPTTPGRSWSINIPATSARTLRY